MKIVPSNKALKPAGPYNHAIISGGFVFCSGQIPLDPVTGEIVAGGIEEQVSRVFENIKLVLSDAGTSLDKIVKVTVFLKDLNDFSGMNKVYTRYIPAGFPARSTLQVSRIPKDALVEIEVIAEAACTKTCS